MDQYFGTFKFSVIYVVDLLKPQEQEKLFIFLIEFHVSWTKEGQLYFEVYMNRLLQATRDRSWPQNEAGKDCELFANGW